LATIIDNDLVPNLIINDQTITEGDSGNSNLTFINNAIALNKNYLKGDRP
jgi:hypothetical protein